mmetsp:Transcript_4000/g.11999  ORF Transcript_4000/g.11999 Transcript_4000/m.11999 type:complete len:625 (+) Transcript_4000:219-2093(+)
MTKVRFNVQVRNLGDGERVAVAGSSRNLGHWKPHRAKPLEQKEDGLWTGVVSFDRDENIFTIEYKYIIIGPRGHREKWLPGHNLKLDPPKEITAQLAEWDLGTGEERSHEKSNEKHQDGGRQHQQNEKQRQDDKQEDTSQRPDREPSAPPLADKRGAVRQGGENAMAWYGDSVFYLIYSLGTPGQGGGGFFGDCPDVNDQVSEPQHRLLRLRQWYDYLVDLGVNAVYFTPIFDSGSHGYDTYDFFRIDRRLGDIDDFKTILAELHERGIRVVLDGVFNHTGRGHFAFSDVLSRGSNWRDSSYKDWYFIKDGRSSYGDKFNYESWSGHQVLPKLNISNRDVRNHIFDIARFWLELGIDGWRLDCASDIKPEFWTEFRKVCDQTKPDSILIGEIIHGDYNAWVDADVRLHSATNYQLYKPIWSSINDKNFFELRHNIERDENMYGRHLLMNFVGNHDVDRIFSILHTDVKKTVLATILMFVIKGVPCIYYGDECCMKGEKRHGGDAALRRAMVLPDDSNWDRSIYHVVKRFVGLRHKYASLRSGKISIPWNTNEGIVIMRSLPGEDSIVAALNCGDRECSAQLAKEAGGGGKIEEVDHFGQKDDDYQGHGTLKLAPMSARIFAVKM